jgi:hypothetical protein
VEPEPEPIGSWTLVQVRLRFVSDLMIFKMQTEWNLNQLKVGHWFRFVTDLGISEEAGGTGTWWPPAGNLAACRTWYILYMELLLLYNSTPMVVGTGTVIVLRIERGDWDWW